jgi:hypothetical protein
MQRGVVLFCTCGANVGLVEPPIAAALISSSVTLISVGIAALTLGHNQRKDRIEREGNEVARQAAETNRVEAMKIAEDNRLEAMQISAHRRSEDADRAERSKAYAEFLVAESARGDAFNDYAAARKLLNHKKFKGGTPEEEARLSEVNAKIETASDAIDRARVAAWLPLSVMRLVASQDVMRAANAYDKAIADSNPRREKVKPVFLQFERKRDLIEAFVVASRADLGRTALEDRALASIDEPSTEAEPGVEDVARSENVE